MKKTVLYSLFTLFCFVSCGEDEETAIIPGGGDGSGGGTAGMKEFPYTPYPAEISRYVTFISQKYLEDGEMLGETRHTFSYISNKQFSNKVITSYKKEKSSTSYHRTYYADLTDLSEPEIEPLLSFSFIMRGGSLKSLSMIVPDELGRHNEFYKFDDGGRIASITSSDRGFYNAERTFSYDTDGNLHQVKEPWDYTDYDGTHYTYTNIAEFFYTDLPNDASIDLNRFLLDCFDTFYTWDEHLLTGHVLFDAFDFAGKRDSHLIRSYITKDNDPTLVYDETLQLNFSYETDTQGRVSRVTVDGNKYGGVYIFDITYGKVK